MDYIDDGRREKKSFFYYCFKLWRVRHRSAENTLRTLQSMCSPRPAWEIQKKIKLNGSVERFRCLGLEETICLKTKKEKNQ